MNFSSRCEIFPVKPGSKSRSSSSGKAENVQVAFHFAPGGDERGVTTGANGQFFHVIRDLSVQEPRAVFADQTDSSAKTQIKHPGVFAERGMFGQPVAIIVHDFRAVQFGKSCAEAVVKFMK